MRVTWMAVLVALTASVAGADEQVLSLELNAAETVDGACRISLLVTNDLPADIAALSVEAVLFDRAGKVARLLSLDLQEAPQGRPRLRQFDLPGLDCVSVKRILINALPVCTGTGLDPGTCLGVLVPRSAVSDIEVIG